MKPCNQHEDMTRSCYRSMITDENRKLLTSYFNSTWKIQDFPTPIETSGIVYLFVPLSGLASFGVCLYKAFLWCCEKSTPNKSINIY